MISEEDSLYATVRIAYYKNLNFNYIEYELANIKP